MDAIVGQDMISLISDYDSHWQTDNDDKMYSKLNKNSNSIGRLRKNALHPTADERL